MGLLRKNNPQSHDLQTAIVRGLIQRSMLLSYDIEIENKLHVAATALDHALLLLKPHQLNGDHLLTSSIKEAIGHLVVGLMHFEQSREKFKEPYVIACCFCRKTEHAVKIIQGPGVTICNECVVACENKLRAPS